MKVRTVGLDLKNAKQIDSAKLSPRNATEKSFDMAAKSASNLPSAKNQGNPDDYSSGESGENFHIPYRQLPEKERKDRILWFWQIAFKKAKGAAILIRK